MCYRPINLIFNRSSAVIVLTAALFFSHTGESFSQDFQQRNRETHLDNIAATNGVAVADYNRDGDLDIFLVAQLPFKTNDRKTWNRLFVNRGDGTFAIAANADNLRGKDAGVNYGGMGSKMGASWGDYNNDGWPDLFLTNFGPNQLFKNNRDGTFTDVTETANVTGGQTQLSSSALWFDYDLDGDLDLYVGTWQDFSGSTGSIDLRNWMYENIGADVFEDVSEKSGLAELGKTWTTVAIDANNDGNLDLYLANDFGLNKFYLNNGDKTFSEKTKEFHLEDRFHGMGLAVTDCDRNGFFDIYLTNITEFGSDEEINPFFLNTGQNYFINYSTQAGVSLAGWGWGTEFFDLENDGDDDLFIVTGNYFPEFINELFRNVTTSDSVRFENISQASGLADSTTARGLAIFDYDDDGDNDLLISNFTETPSLYENQTPQGNWLKIKLEGTISNNDGFGSVVEIESAGSRQAKYHHGAQFLAQNILPLHFGLGSTSVVDKIRVKWPSGHVDEIGQVAANQTLQIKEMTGVVSGIHADARAEPLPENLHLLGNYPNPFNGSTRISFELTKPGTVEIDITNIRGQRVSTLHARFDTAGRHSILWQAADDTNRQISSGFYFYRIRNEGAKAVPAGRMLYLR